ncbi:MAG: hypothetical protein FRX48_01788 [Lasallia pustulata]|uniref:Uncharacterized protein n=1 Tax=Lasallia pustulata TaxID=136370 RepID=A0A5M8Q017_9LECA|nr:MAG: hypothetical protein FRX48_01788 [Lasallia pustulata]
MPSYSAAPLSTSFSGAKSGTSTSSNGSYASIDQSLRGHAQKTAHQTSGTGHRGVLPVHAAQGGNPRTGATNHGSTAAVNVTSGSVSRGGLTRFSGKDCAIPNHGGLPTDASKEDKKHDVMTTKAKKRSAKKHDLSYQNVYTMGDDKDSFGRAHVGSGSGAPTGCSLM